MTTCDIASTDCTTDATTTITWSEVDMRGTRTLTDLRTCCPSCADLLLTSLRADGQVHSIGTSTVPPSTHL